MSTRRSLMFTELLLAIELEVQFYLLNNY